MNLLSKSAPLEESILKMQKVLADMGCKMSFSVPKHPLNNCYSINLTSAEVPSRIYSNGKGVVPEASMASALGEFIERLQTNNFFGDFYLPSREHYPDERVFEFGGGFLDTELLDIYDPHGELGDEDLIDYNSDHKDRIVSLPFKRLSDGAKVYFPVNILANLYVSNGLASGNTPKEAQVQSLSEIYERHVKLDIIKNGYALPAFDDETVKSFERVYEDVKALREKGFIVKVLDASLGGRFPVTAVSLINPKNSSLFVSFGAHPILQVSLERTMTELMQGRNLDELDAFEMPTFDMSLVADSFNLESHFIDSNAKLGFGFLSSKKSFALAPWKYDGEGIDDELEYLVNIAEEMGKEIYLREYDYLGFYSCQMLIPSVSEVYPVEDLVYNNKNDAKRVRDMVLNFTKYDPEDILEEVESLDDSLSVGKYIGVIFQEDFSMALFKAQLYLLLGERGLAREYCILSGEKLPHVVSELICMEEEGLLYEDFEEGLFDVFSEKKVKKALRILEGEEFLVHTAFHNDYLDMLSLYDRLEVKKRRMRDEL